MSSEAVRLLMPEGASPLEPPRYFRQYESNEVLTNLCESWSAVQGEVPLTAQCESAALPPLLRPEVRRDPAFILTTNTSAGGSRHIGNPDGAIL